MCVELALRGVRCTLVEPRARKLTRAQRRRLTAAGFIVNGGFLPAATTVAAAAAAAGGSSTTISCTSISSSSGNNVGDGGVPFVHIVARLDASFDGSDVGPSDGVSEDDECTWRRQLLASASIIVGMHPDQATEAIVDAALRYDRSFAVVPCCVFSRQFPWRTIANTAASSSTAADTGASSDTADTGTATAAGSAPTSPPRANAAAVPQRRVRSYIDFLAYLRAKHARIVQTSIGVEGRNRVLFLRQHTPATT